MINGRACPICGCYEKKKLFDITFSEDIARVLAKKNEIVVCNVCGFTFADNECSQVNYDNYYSHYNIYSEDSDVKISDRDYVPPIMNILNKYCNKKHRIIDVGAGDGFLLRTLKKQGFLQLYGMDPSIESTKKIKSLGIEACTQSIFDEIPTENISHFDVVCSTCVAEHIFDLNKYMYQISKLLKEGGQLVIQVPSVEAFEKNYYPLPNYFNHEHINYFSINTLDRLCSKFNFARISSDDEIFVQSILGDWLIEAVYAKQVKVNIDMFKDKISEESISHYYNKNLDKEKNMSHKVLDFVMKYEKIVLWGCGSYAIQFLTKNANIKNHIAYCVDNNKLLQGHSFQGIQVYSPDELLSNPMPIIIFSMMNSTDIMSQIKKMGLNTDVFAIGSSIIE